MYPLSKETKPAAGFRIFSMYRISDSSKVSGTGYILHGVIFPDLKVVVQWTCSPDPGDTQIKATFEKFLDTHVKSHLTNDTIISFQDGERWLYNEQYPEGYSL